MDGMILNLTIDQYSHIVHDANNAIGIIYGSLDLLLDQATDSETKAILEDALSAASSLAEHIKVLQESRREQP